MSEFKIGDRVKCIEPGYSFMGKLGTIMSQKGDLFKVEIDGMGVHHYLHFAEDMELDDPLLTAAKALLTFLDDHSTQDVPAGFRPATRIDPAEPIYLDLSSQGLVAFPEAELTRLQEKLQQAIEKAGGE